MHAYPRTASMKLSSREAAEMSERFAGGAEEEKSQLHRRGTAMVREFKGQEEMQQLVTIWKQSIRYIYFQSLTASFFGSFYQLSLQSST